MSRLLLAGFLVLSAATLRADEEQDLIAALQSGAGAPQKCAACVRLKVIGTAKAVPAIASLLGDERVSQAARHALESIPGPEAGAALRAALAQNSGAIKAGVADALGWRGERAAVPLLIPLLADADAVIASAAANALGKIGGDDALAALFAVRDSAGPRVQPAVLEALLKCADRLRIESDSPNPPKIFAGLLDAKYPAPIRAAAWRGLVLSDPGQRVALVTKALAGGDQTSYQAALKLLRELEDAPVLKACLDRWASLSAEAQLALLDAQVKAGRDVLPVVRTAWASPHLEVRVAAWQALGDLNDPATIPMLAKTAALDEPTERDAARETLARLRGPEMRAALIGQISAAEPAAKAELLRALGARGDTGAGSLLLQHAGSANETVRLAALEALQRLALPDTLTPLLDLAAKADSEKARDPVLKALYAVCQISKDKEQTSRQIIETMNRFPAAQRRQVLPLLAELGTASALAAAQTALKDPDAELAKEAVRVLGRWPNAAPAPQLLELARTSPAPAVQVLAVRGCIELAAKEADAGQRLVWLQQCLDVAKRPEEKRQALSQIGQTPTLAALEAAMKALENPGLANEAALAAVSIAEKLAPANPQLGNDVAVKILAVNNEPDIAKRAWAMRFKPQGAGSFIQNWLICGPYRQADLTGATAFFAVPFGPEKAGEKVVWKVAPRGNSISLSLLFPGQDNCVAYARTQITAPNDCDGVLLLGSDDGVKAWLNGTVVHANNVDRGEVADQDSAPIKLKKGANQLMLKITQGGGGWSFCARIVGADGKPIPNLVVEMPADGPPATKPAP